MTDEDAQKEKGGAQEVPNSEKEPAREDVQSPPTPTPGGGGGGGGGGSTLPPPTPEPDRWPVRLGIAFLGLIALLCIIALIWLSQKPAPPGTEEAANAQAAIAQEGALADAAGPVATQVAGEAGTLGLLGQMVGVLATVAAAAVGGISGFLTGSRTGNTGAAPLRSPGQGGANDSS